MDGVEDRGRDYGLLARTALFGAVAAGVLFYALVAAGWDPYEASEVAFSLPALVFGFGLVGWSTVLLSGEALEGFSREFGISESWTVESGRQAMAVLSVLGFGGMVGAALAAAPYGV